MKKTIKVSCGVLALSVGLFLPSSVLAVEAPEVDKFEKVVSESQVQNKDKQQEAMQENESKQLEKDVPEVKTEQETDKKAEKAPEETVKPKEAVKAEDEKDEKAVVKKDAKVTTPLAVAKANLSVEVNSSVTPAYFAEAKPGVALSFKAKPVLSTIGKKSVVIEATDGTTTEEVTVSYTVVDTKAPVLNLVENNPEFGVDEEWFAEELVDVSDNSDNYEVFFADGSETLNTSKAGTFSAVIVARDAAGNESRITLTYTVIDEEAFDYEAPQIDPVKSTATDVYGKTKPNAHVQMASEDGVVIGEALADANGNFHIHLATPLKSGSVVFIWSFILETGEVSDVGVYTYGNMSLLENKGIKPVQAVKNPVKSAKPAKPVVKTVAKQADPAALPKTGDAETGGLAAAGTLLAVLAGLYLRKRN
ncbi:Ig-like domain-containing protein [Listeria aquatica]|uniref:LPXTG cell wall anchor domain-containing protein n=1 Tax=Listeria aquatica TaxID=1494960 RepID=UPI003F6F3992